MKCYVLFDGGGHWRWADELIEALPPYKSDGKNILRLNLQSREYEKFAELFPTNGMDAVKNPLWLESQADRMSDFLNAF